MVRVKGNIDLGYLYYLNLKAQYRKGGIIMTYKDMLKEIINNLPEENCKKICEVMSVFNTGIPKIETNAETEKYTDKKFYSYTIAYKYLEALEFKKLSEYEYCKRNILATIYADPKGGWIVRFE